MQHGQVDLVITGADRVTRAGDAANKIGTYLKALAARDNDVPFYIALPSSTFDWKIRDGLTEIPIEARPAREVTHLLGLAAGAEAETEFQILAPPSSAANPAFDVTPARLITALITERGLCAATESAIIEMFPEQRPSI
jgi:methylthioribose-1-phosphate isomerase